jgi:2-hydroxy-3-keto-5-methylthiopentenyl-1-phosphate phosphatase
VDPFFADFARFCRRAGHTLYVLSDGFDYWIRRILRRVLTASDGNWQLPIFACSLTFKSPGVKIFFPYFPEGCSHGCATCKPTVFSKLRAATQKTVVIGDGSSDFLLSRGADLVLAKGTLRRFCQLEHILHEPFENFTEVVEKIQRFKRELETAPE